MSEFGKFVPEDAETFVASTAGEPNTSNDPSKDQFLESRKSILDSDPYVNPGNLVGTGTEKRVYQDELNPDRVIGIYRENSEKSRQTPTELKGRYYLSKILHALMPNNFPDIHYATGKSNALIMEKITDDNNQTVPWSETTEEEREAFAEHVKNITGINIDTRNRNFIRRNGELVYVDNESPWETFRMGGLKEARRSYSPEILEQTIETLPEELQVSIRNNLDRLEELNNELMTEFKPYNDLDLKQPEE